MYANWAPSLGGLEVVTGETKVRVEVGCVDRVYGVVGRGCGGGGGADDNMRKRYSQGRLWRVSSQVQSMTERRACVVGDTQRGS